MSHRQGSPAAGRSWRWAIAETPNATLWGFIVRRWAGVTPHDLDGRMPLTATLADGTLLDATITSDAAWAEVHRVKPERT